jgi:hypothetical protein
MGQQRHSRPTECAVMTLPVSMNPKMSLPKGLGGLG